MEHNLLQESLRVIKSQNLIIENLQKNLDELNSEKNKQKLKNRLRVEKSNLKKKQLKDQEGGGGEKNEIKEGEVERRIKRGRPCKMEKKDGKKQMRGESEYGINGGLGLANKITILHNVKGR